jgi:hypothetical protein
MTEILATMDHHGSEIVYLMTGKSQWSMLGMYFYGIRRRPAFSFFRMNFCHWQSMVVRASPRVFMSRIITAILTDLTLSQILDVFKLLTLTYPRYSDGASRDAVEAVGMELVRRDELRGTPGGAPDENKLGVTEQILGWLSNEVSRFATHTSSR